MPYKAEGFLKGVTCTLYISDNVLETVQDSNVVTVIFLYNSAEGNRISADMEHYSPSVTAEPLVFVSLCYSVTFCVPQQVAVK